MAFREAGQCIGHQQLAAWRQGVRGQRGEVGKGGVVRDAAIHARVCAEVQDWLRSAGWDVKGLTESPITGPKGNVEFLVWAGCPEQPSQS